MIAYRMFVYGCIIMGNLKWLNQWKQLAKPEGCSWGRWTLKGEEETKRKKIYNKVSKQVSIFQPIDSLKRHGNNAGYTVRYHDL